MANSLLSKLRKLQAQFQDLLDEKSSSAASSVPGTKMQAWFLSAVIIGRRFFQHRCPLRAASLAYTTVLALVPMLAIVVSVSSGFLQKEGSEPIRNMIDYSVSKLAPLLSLQQIQDEEEANIARERLTQAIHQSIGNINSGTLGVAAVLVLIFLAISLLSTVEVTLNDIWGVSRGRSWITRVLAYWAFLTLGPLFLLTAVGLTSAGQVEQTRAWIEQYALLKNVVFFLLPTLIFTVALALLYLLMPNTKVDWRAALLGGLVAGLLLQLNNHFNVLGASRVITYHKIYGSLSIIPLFLFGLYVSWCVVLLGAQVACTTQYGEWHGESHGQFSLDQRGREQLALRLAARVAKNFQSGAPPLSAAQLAERVRSSSPCVERILQELTKAKLLVEASQREKGYLPARPLENMTVHDLLRAMRSNRSEEPSPAEKSSCPIDQAMDRIAQAEKEIAAKLTWKELADSANS